DTFDGREWKTVRGVGGVHTRRGPMVGVAEENLTQDRDFDRYYGASTALHEAAHIVHDRGLPHSERAAIARHFRELKRSGNPEAFTDAYAASNVREYFAQATMAYFNVNVTTGQE